MKKSKPISTLSACMFFIITTSTNAALHPRLETFVGSGVFQAYYDDQLNITWADTNTDISSPLFNWNSANSWAAGLTIGGITGWRLPSVDVNNDNIIDQCGISSTQAQCKDNEFGHLYWYGAGSTHGLNITGGNSNPFTGIFHSWYWSSTPHTGPGFAYIFDFGVSAGGDTTLKDLGGSHFAWAVYDGDVADKDGDGILDNVDNCIDIANPDQEDTDSDGHGNICDGDFDNTCGPVDFTDLALFKAAFFTASPLHDLDINGVVDFTDLAIFKGLFFLAPGPSGADQVPAPVCP